MATNTAQVSPPVRQDPRQVLNTLKQTITWSDAGIGSGIAFQNSLPAGAFIINVMVEIVAAFDGGSSLLIGTNAASYNNLVAAGDVDELTIAVTSVTRGLGRGITAAADITPFYMVTGGLTKGSAVVIITYDAGFAT